MAAQAIAYTRTSLPDDVEQLKDIIVTLSTHLESLHQQILNLRRLHFGATSERLAGQIARRRIVTPSRGGNSCSAARVAASGSSQRQRSTSRKLTERFQRKARLR